MSASDDECHNELHLLQQWSLACLPRASHVTPRAGKVTWILGDANAAQFLTGEDDWRDALVKVRITKFGEDAFRHLCQYSTCKEACQKLSHSKVDHQ